MRQTPYNPIGYMVKQDDDVLRKEIERSSENYKLLDIANDLFGIINDPEEIHVLF